MEKKEKFFLEEKDRELFNDYIEEIETDISELKEKFLNIEKYLIEIKKDDYSHIKELEELLDDIPDYVEEIDDNVFAVKELLEKRKNKIIRVTIFILLYIWFFWYTGFISFVFNFIKAFFIK